MQFDFTLGPNQSQQLDVKGKFFKFKSGTGLIRVRTSSGDSIDLLPGQGVWSVDYQSLSVQDRTGANNAGVLLAGDFDFHDDRISGTVDVVDGGKSRTIANSAFMGASSSGNPQAGQYPHVQLWNPAGNTKRIIVKQILISAVDAQQVALVGSTASLGGVPTYPVSKLIGGGPSVVEIHAMPNAVLQGSGGLVQPYMAANSNLPIVFSEPIVLLPGCGIILRGALQQSTIGATFETYEESL